jgi:hypothetical protein
VDCSAPGRPSSTSNGWALDRYRWKANVDDPHSYWVTVKQAAAILGVSRQRVKQLLEADRLPYVVAARRREAHAPGAARDDG